MRTAKTLTVISCLVNVFNLTYIIILIRSFGNFTTGWKYNVFFEACVLPARGIEAKHPTDRSMTNSEPDLSRQVVIVNELGMHARSAAKIAAIANRSTAAVWIQKGDQRADASSIVDILTLACEKGSKITINIENKSDSNILEAIAELVESGFGE